MKSNKLTNKSQKITIQPQTTRSQESTATEFEA